MKKTKCLLTIIVIATIFNMFLPAITYAQLPAQVNIYAWTDKTNYDPGESGKLTIVIRNDRTDVDLILYNITIKYPWFSYNGQKWEGNDTITVGETLMKNGGAKTFTRSFTVPTDGRAAFAAWNGASIVITARVNEEPYSYTGYATIYVRGLAYPMSIQEWDKIITLLTVQTVLLIVCTIIIAATIFLSTRKPKAVWVEEEEKRKSE